MTTKLLIWLTALLCAGLASFTIAAPNDCKPFVRWYAELYPDNPSFIKVTVDTQGIAENQYIDNVSFRAAFYDGRNQYIAQGSFNFPDEQIQGLSRGFYVAYIPHSYAAAQSANGREMEFLCKIKGLAFVGPRDRVPASAAHLERMSDARSTLIGNVPERTEPQVRDHRDAQPQVRDHRDAQPQVRDHRDAQPQVRDHRDAQPQEEKVPALRGSADYLVSWFKPTRIPADLEDWLNTRMRGFALVAVTRDDNSGRYNSFFTKLRQGSKPWNYKVMIVPETSIEEVLNRASTQGWRLVTVTSEWHGLRGLQYICFFREVAR